MGLGEVLRGLGLNPTNGDVDSIVKELGSSSRMTFEEFLPIYESMLQRMESKKSKTAVDFLECFRVFDREQNGTINIGELKHVMSTLRDSHWMRSMISLRGWSRREKGWSVSMTS